MTPEVWTPQYAAMKVHMHKLQAESDIRDKIFKADAKFREDCEQSKSNEIKRIEEGRKKKLQQIKDRDTQLSDETDMVLGPIVEKAKFATQKATELRKEYVTRGKEGFDENSEPMRKLQQLIQEAEAEFDEIRGYFEVAKYELAEKHRSVNRSAPFTEKIVNSVADQMIEEAEQFWDQFADRRQLPMQLARLEM